MESVKWDIINISTESYYQAIRDGAIFIIASHSLHINMVDKEMSVIEKIRDDIRNYKLVSGMYQNIEFDLIDLEQLYLNMISWIQAQKQFLVDLIIRINNCASYTELKLCVWVTQNPELPTEGVRLLDSLEHHNDLYYTKDEIKRIEQFNLSSETFRVIDHTLYNIFPNVIIIDSGGNVLEATIEYISNTRINVGFTNPFTGKVILS